MDPDLSLLPQTASQLRGALSNLYFAASRLAPNREREGNPELDAKAALVDQSYYRLVRLVNNLSATQYLSGAPLPTQDRDIVDFVSEVFTKTVSLASLRGLEIRFVCAADRYACAFNSDALEQLLYQLLSNAFKFTPAGGLITVGLRFSAGRVFLFVEDNGPGIPPERLETLFDGYRQSGRPGPPAQGLGLGLALCQGIARSHGGVMTAESQEGKGSRFTFSMPSRLSGATLAEPRFDYSGGFNRTLMALSDAMPPEAFEIRRR